ncbi:MAG TPA: right-handed parallel beta-helix repeat-containing protein, partial [bacterium]|nr:right-handed parallel beta-helix repeat-containing protein [bacterium]
MKNISTIIILIAVTGGANAAIRYVPDDYPTIQQAIDASFNGDEVVIRDGMYHGEGFRDITYQGKSLTVRSENGPDNCCITGEFETEPFSAFRFDDPATTNAVLSGLTIMRFQDTAAVTVFCSEPKFDNCVFKENKELAIYADFDPSYCNLLNPNFIIQNCSFISNDRQSSACAAVWIQGCPNINFSDNVFVDNRGYDFGGALFLWNCSGHVTNCVFESNICRSWSVSTSYGGAVCTWCTSVRFENCLFFDNQVIGNYYPPTEADSYGGAISLDSYQVPEPNQLINCTFVDNEQWIHNGAGGHSQYGFGCGGAIYVQWGYAADIVNCVVWYNEDMFTSYNSLSDSICAGDYTVDSSWIEFHPSGIEPPQFEDYANDLFYLSSTSPLIDQGNAPADEICFDTVSGTQCLSEMTTQISGVPDTGIADIGYHYRTTPSPIPTVTPTSTATDTPTITPSPTITPTPTDTPIPTDSPTPTVT